MVSHCGYIEATGGHRGDVGCLWYPKHSEGSFPPHVEPCGQVVINGGRGILHGVENVTLCALTSLMRSSMIDPRR